MACPFSVPGGKALHKAARGRVPDKESGCNSPVGLL